MVIGTCTSYAQHGTSNAQHGQGRAHALLMSRSLLHCPRGSDSRLASILRLFVLKLLPFRAVLFRKGTAKISRSQSRSRHYPLSPIPCHQHPSHHCVCNVGNFITKTLPYLLSPRFGRWVTLHTGFCSILSLSKNERC